jgi:hypothetical protein
MYVYVVLTGASADPREVAVSSDKSKLPTNKWLATQVTAAAALLTGWVTAEHWNKTLTTTAIGLVAQAIVSYVLPNSENPGGVPPKKATAPAQVGVTV